MPTTTIKAFGPVSSLTESTEVGLRCTRLTNIMLRPDRGFRGMPIYHRLFGSNSAQTVQATIRALTFGGTPIGDTDGRRATNKTVAVQVECQAQHFLLLYDLTATSAPARGWFYLGEKGAAPSTLNLDGGTITYTVLAVGLDARSRWYGNKTFSQWMIGNGVDDNVIVQLNRTATPGIWRKAASNAKPTAPVISLVPPSSTGLTQASWTVDTRLKLTADEDNYPGTSGNDRIRVTINPTVAAITSTLTGTGSPLVDPYNYVVTGGAVSVGTSITYPNASDIRTFINADTKVVTILQALLTGSDAPISSIQGPTYLSGGAGSGSSTGFSDRTATVIARYWDPGQEQLGYEGISSDESNTLVIGASQNYDIRVRLTPDPTAEGGRFPFIRIYLNFTDADGNEIWSLMNPNDPIPNTTPSSLTFTANTTTDRLTTSAAHGLSVNDIVRLTTTGTLPAPLSASTDYVVVAVPSTTTLQLGSTIGGTVINITTAGSGTHTLQQQRIVQLGSNSDIGQAMSEDQNRPLPHVHHGMANNQVWRAGVTGFQERLYASKAATVDEIAPEGCNSEDYTTVQSSTNAAGANRISAVYTDGQWLHLHTPAGILLVDPTNPMAPPREPQVSVGAINGVTMVALPDRRLMYVGSDVSLIQFDASLQLQEIVGNASIASAQATTYIRSRVDTDAIANNTDRAHAYMDAPSQMVWFYLPGVDGDLIGFGYDLINDGIVGEFTLPRVYASAMMERSRPEITFIDEDGNMLYMDPIAQAESDSYGSQGAFTPQAVADPIPVADAGYGNVLFDAGTGEKRYLRAGWCYLETGYYDLGSPANRKAFQAFIWRTIQGSRAIVKVTFEDLEGNEETYTYGDVGDVGSNHRVCLMMSDSAVRMKLEILQAEQKKWAVRDCAFDWKPQAYGSL